jgi:uroporphyrinogen-III decarboxylase
MPVFSFTVEFYATQAGVRDGDLRENVDRAVACQLEALRRYDEDWAIVFPDDYIEFEPLGLPMRSDPDLPAIPTAYLPFERDTLRGFRIPDAARAMRMPLQLEMLRRVKRAVGDTALVMGRVAAPFSALALVYGIQPAMLATRDDPRLLADNLRFFVEHQAAFGQAQLAAGADLVWLGDCCAASCFLGPGPYARFAFEPAFQTAEALGRAGGLVIYHNAETSPAHLRYQVQLPVQAVNVGERNGARIAELKRQLAPKLCLMGNFDPKLLRDATPHEVEAAAEQMIRENLPGGHYIFCTGEGVMRTTPPANYEAMCRTVRRLGLEAPRLVAGG